MGNEFSSFSSKSSTHPSRHNIKVFNQQANNYWKSDWLCEKKDALCPTIIPSLPSSNLVARCRTQSNSSQDSEFRREPCSNTYTLHPGSTFSFVGSGRVVWAWFGLIRLHCNYCWMWKRKLCSCHMTKPSCLFFWFHQ